MGNIITINKHRYLLFSVLTFLGIVLYELNINIAFLFKKLYAETSSFAILINDDEFVLLDQEAKFIINNTDNNTPVLTLDHNQFLYMDYNTGMINGKIDITTIKSITIIKPTEILGNRAKELGKKGMKIGAMGGFLLINLIAIKAGDFPDAIFPSFICGAVDGLVLGVTGATLGSVTSEVKTYAVDENEWQFVDSSTLQIFRNQ